MGLRLQFWKLRCLKPSISRRPIEVIGSAPQTNHVRNSIQFAAGASFFSLSALMRYAPIGMCFTIRILTPVDLLNNKAVYRGLTHGFVQSNVLMKLEISLIKSAYCTSVASSFVQSALLCKVYSILKPARNLFRCCWHELLWLA